MLRKVIRPKKSKQWYKEMFDLYYEKIRNFLYYKTKDIDIAEDLVQDVFLKLWEVRDKVKDETISSYLYRIAENSFINFIKKEKNKEIYLSLSNNKFSFETPDFIMEGQEFHKILENVISKMPEKTRQIFLMNRIDKLTYNEIAKNLEISVKTVEKHMQKSLNLLREKLEVIV